MGSSRVLAIVMAATLSSVALSACPNMCSGHGSCRDDNWCECDKDYGAGDETFGDCSEMFCPYEIAWVDDPNQDGHYHNYRECAGKGICDRGTGECDCFDGYTGKGCARSTCPNDCSGHGTCEYIEEVGHGGIVPGHYDSTKNNLGIHKGSHKFVGPASEMWDYHKTMKCVCDKGFFEIDCSKRMCHTGNDVLDTRLDASDVLQTQKQNITLYAAGPTGNGSSSVVSEFYGRTFALTFVSTLNESFTTIPIVVEYQTDEFSTELALSTQIEKALESLPNKVIDDCTANVTLGYDSLERGHGFGVQYDTIAFMQIEVAFVGAGVQGTQNLLQVEMNECSDGCMPKINGLNLVSAGFGENVTSFVAEKMTADYNAYECGRRGKCDYDTGLCECFTGFVGETCGTQSSLV
eukprot:CAMPEP_0205921426 /NCGR_PEP_ID=MMETSP1325-20131115/12802_1 /ASSEMBLY_ACC=CAM_ASM_000708 /TAXON_ID=236786 /ORGANISM="Florenciella sp., Strain RCC1007" /LENGTH=406 /DNA_ID=CAMNT_0053289253 /DNA_START=105 /DNA_END=1325 /DNA_ORIENTATION=-